MERKDKEIGEKERVREKERAREKMSRQRGHKKT
jgi:hypothetical protein